MSRHLLLIVALLVSVPLLAPGSAQAAEPWEGKPFAGKPQAIASAAAKVTAPAGADLVTLLEETTHHFDKNGHRRITWRKVFKVLTTDGARRWSTLSVPWSPWFESKPVLRARAIAPDGTVTVMSAKSLTTTPAPPSPQVSGHRRRIQGSLPAMAPGVVIEEVVTRRDNGKHQPGGASYREFLAADTATAKMRLIIDTPHSLKLRHKSWLLPGKPRVYNKNGRRRVVYERFDVRPVKQRESSLPRSQSSSAQVIFSTAASWKAVARGQYAAIARALRQGLPAGVTPKKGKSRAESLANVLAMLRAQVTDSTLGLWQGPAQPRSPADTWNSQVGDSKDMSTLLVALLASVGIQAHVVLASADNELDVPAALPGAGLFNYALVVVPGAPDLWIEPTLLHARAGELPSFYQDRRVLVLKPGTKALTRTPAGTARDHRVHELREIYVADYGTSRVVEVASYAGEFERKIRSDYAKSGTPELKKRLTDYARGEYVGKGDVTSRWSNPSDPSTPFQLTVELADSARANCGTETCAIYMPVHTVLDKLPTILLRKARAKAATTRTRDFRLPVPHTYSLEYRVHLPDGWRIREKPPDETLDLGSATLEGKLTLKGRILTAVYALKVSPGRLSPDQLRRFRKKTVAFYSRNPIKLVLEHAAVADASAGKTAAAVAELRRLGATQPKSAAQRWRMIDVLMPVGLQGPALEQAKEAIAIDGSAVSYGYLGWVHSHDQLGRQYGAGFDRRASIKAFRAAVALDSNYAWGFGELGDVLERNRRGYRYAGDLSAAADALSKAYELDGSKAAEFIDVLAHNGHWVEARELAVKAGLPSTNLTIVAATSVIEGPATALARARSLASGAPRLLIDGAIGLLMMFNNYTAMEELRVHAGKAGIATSLAGTSQQAVFKRLKPWKSALHGKRDPRRAVQLDLAHSLGLLGGAKAYKKNLSRSARALAADNPGRTRNPIRKVLRSYRFSPASVLGSSLASLDMKIAERKPWGIRIEVSAGGQTNQAFVIKENGRFKFLAMDWAPPLAAEALRALRRGDERAARGWLRWAQSAEPRRSNTTSSSRLWAEENGSSRGAIERGAAAFLGRTALARRALPLLSGCPEDNVRVAIACAESMMSAATTLEDAAAMRHAIAILDRHRTLDERIPHLRASAAYISGAWDDVLTTAQHQLKKSPKDSGAIFAETLARCSKTDNAGCHRLFSAASKTLSTAFIHNELAWQALIAGVHDNTTLAAVNAAVSHQRRAAALNTLAAVQAVRGDLIAAHTTLVESVGLEADQTPDVSDWLVHGRIAAACGYPKVARRHYQQVKKDLPFTAHHGTWDLAQRWLSDLPKR